MFLLLWQILDGLKSLVDIGFSDKVTSIMENITGQPQMVVFSDCCKEISASLLHSLLKGPICRLSLDDSVICQSAFISQNIHVYLSEDEKMSKVYYMFLLSTYFATKLSAHIFITFIDNFNRKYWRIKIKLISHPPIPSKPSKVQIATPCTL